MRWLGILAILIAGAAVYLYSQLSNGETAPRRDRPAAPAVTEEDQPAAKSETAPTPAPPPPPEAKREPVPAANIARPSTPPSSGGVAATVDKPAPPDGNQEDVPWTEQERQQWLWTAHGRYEKGNYPGALEASMEIARRNPDSPWEQDAWKVAIQTHCAMSEPDKANKLFAKMTDKTAIEAATKVCGEWNVKLAAP